MSSQSQSEEMPPPASPSDSNVNVADPWPHLSDVYSFLGSSRGRSDQAITLRYRCNLCNPAVTLTANKTTQSNLKRHMKRKHPTHHERWEDAFAGRQSLPADGDTSDTDAVTTPRKRKQHRIEEWISSASSSSLKRGCTQAQANEAIDNLIIKEMLPFQLVEQASFRTLLATLNPSVKMSSRPALLKRLKAKYLEKKNALIRELVEVPYVAATCDVWSTHHKSFFGMSVHWIDGSLVRKSTALACRRLTGRHTFDILAEKIQSLLIEFGIAEKVIMITTDSGSNFVKAFKVFTTVEITHASSPIACLSDDENSEPESALLSCTSVASDSEVGIQTGDEVALCEDIHGKYGKPMPFTVAMKAARAGKLPTALTGQASLMEDSSDNEEEEESEEEEEMEEECGQRLISLPPHQRCAVHLLNLVATTDCDKGLGQLSSVSGIQPKKELRGVMGILRGFWNKYSRSTSSADWVKKKLGGAPIIPVITRWNSLYEALKWLHQHLAPPPKKAVLDALFNDLNLNSLNALDCQMLNEYIKVLHPIAQGIDFLQGEKNTWFGCLIPALESIVRRLNASGQDLVYLAPLAKYLSLRVTTRFQSIFTSESGRLAAAFHPNHRMTFISTESERLQVRALMIQALKDLQEDIPSTDTTSSGRGGLDLENVQLLDVLQRGSQTSTQSRQISASQCVDAFLGAPDGDAALAHIRQSPQLKRLFVKFNTPLPSSASVERLFSSGKDILRPKRVKMTDSHFDMIMFLRANAK